MILLVVLLTTLLVCTISVQAISDTQILENIDDYDSHFYQNKNLKTPNGEESYQIIEGSGKVLLTAPHTVNHIRKGRTKLREVCTGAYAEVLHDLTNAPVIYMNYKDIDSNYYDDTEFKFALSNYLDEHPEIKIVFDMHGASSTRPFDIDLGTMNGKSLNNKWFLPYLMKRYFKRENIKDISFNHFSAAYQDTVTKFVSKRGLVAVQIEINREFRCGEDEKTLDFVKSMKNIIERIN